MLAFTVDDDQNNAHYSAIIPFILNSNGMIFVRLNKGIYGRSLAHHQRYKTIIAANNEVGTSNSTGEILFSKLLYVYVRL